MYYYGARYYDPRISMFYGVDPLAEENNFQSPFVYADNNPIRFIDFLGMDASTLVEENENGTYTVVGGDANDGDNGVYIDDGNGGKGEKVGETMTSHSFFDEKENAVVGAEIDPKSTEGQDFIDNEIIDENPGVISYAIKAGPQGGDLDFKSRGVEKKGEKTELQHKYRGSVAKDGKFGSARDFGNAAGGIVTGRANAPWELVKKAFDKLQGGAEPKVSRKAQELGFKQGQTLYIKDLLNGKGD